MSKEKSRFTIVLVAPEIPGNTGSIGRTCVALGLRLVLIKPLAFDISEKAVRRAGLDYWKYVDIQVYENFDHFLETEKPSTDKMYFFTKTATSKSIKGLIRPFLYFLSLVIFFSSVNLLKSPQYYHW